MENIDKVKEYERCSTDPNYFIKKYIYVVHPIRGLVPFELYPFQDRIVEGFDNHRFSILRKFRQAGCTTICAAYSLWFVIFNNYKQVVILSKGDAESTELLDRIKIMYDYLPSFLQPKIVENNKHTFRLATKSGIKSRASGKESGRSLAGSLLIIDEGAFIENIDTIWAAAYPVISTGGRAFVLSTVNGIGNWYHTLWMNAKEEKNAFFTIDIHWKEHPEYYPQKGLEELYIPNWEETTRSNMPYKKWLQEYECEFLGTGDTYIEGETLNRLNEHINDEFYTKYNHRMRIWESPLPYHEYLISVDTGLGRKEDYSAFHVIDLYNGNQVAEFYSNSTKINEFAEIIYNEGNIYNIAYVVAERNTIGANLIEWLYDILEYENLWYDEKNEIGIMTSSKSRDNILAAMEEALRMDRIRINSRRTMEELYTFIVTETGKVEADVNQHDDLVLSLAFGTYAMKSLYSTTPIEHLQKMPQRELGRTPDPKWFANVKSHDGEITQEDLRWLMK